MPSLLQPPVREIASAIADGKLTAAALADAVIANHDASEAARSAYKTWDADRLKANAAAADAVLKSSPPLGVLHGIPVSVKDIYGVKGYPTFAGTPAQLPTKWEREGPVVSAIRHQMGVVTGKTHTVELAFGGIGKNPHWETPRNPWDPKEHRAPGGSSSGAGVSLSTGTALVAMGTDTAGSVRIPASATGNVGLKTSFGRWPVDGIVPLSPSLDTAGLLARTVADAAVAFVALDPWSDGSLRTLDRLMGAEIDGLRIGVADDFFWDPCSPGIAEGVKGALDELSKKGARLVSLPIPEVDIYMPIFVKGGLPPAELYAFLRAELPDWLDKIDPIVQLRMEEASTLPAHEYLERVRVLGEAAKAADDRLSSVDVMVCPTLAITPPKLAEVEAIEDYRQANLAMLRNTAAANYLGLCALTMPVALDKAGMPVGMQLFARASTEDRLLRAAAAIERVLGTGRERLGAPPLGV